MSDSKTNEWDTPAYNEACRLVGRFMHDWALLETTLNSGVRKILGLRALEAAIVNNNMQCRSKIHIIKTYINLSGAGSAWHAKAIKNMEAIGDMSDKRNIVAHVPFAPHKNGGVEFITIKAKGKLTFPDIVWAKSEFYCLCMSMAEMAAQLDKDMNRLALTRSLADLAASAPKEDSQRQGALNALLPLLQGTPDSRQPNPDEGLQTPQEPKA